MFTPTGEEWNDNARDGLMPGIRVDTIKELLRLNGRWRTIRSETFFLKNTSRHLHHSAAQAFKGHCTNDSIKGTDGINHLDCEIKFKIANIKY